MHSPYKTSGFIRKGFVSGGFVQPGGVTIANALVGLLIILLNKREAVSTGMVRLLASRTLSPVKKRQHMIAWSDRLAHLLRTRVGAINVE